VTRRSVIIAIVVLAFVPWIAGNRYVLHVATMVAIMVPLALSMNLMLRIGQLSMAQSAFMGIGAYAAALLTSRHGFAPGLALLTGGVLAGMTALLFGPVFLRIKGVYFVLLTYAFGEIVNLSFQEWTSLFGGNSGLYGIPKFSFIGFRLTNVSQYYILGLCFAAITYGAVLAIERSGIGAILASLNEDEMLSRSVGADALAWRIAIFTFSAVIAGISGGIYAFYIGFLSPSAFGFTLSVDLVVMNVIGGPSSALGPLLGAIIVVPLPELLRGAQEYQLLIYGLCLIVFLVFIKQGLVAFVDRPKRASL
jgi:branched-chain amino acid transport system permease protein